MDNPYIMPALVMVVNLAFHMWMSSRSVQREDWKEIERKIDVLRLQVGNLEVKIGPIWDSIQTKLGGRQDP